MTAPRPAKIRLALILGGLVAFGPLSIDMYLPAFPAMARHLDTGPSQIQLTLTAFMIGLALGQLVAGPLSDAFGRRRPLAVGLALYTVTSLACAVAPSAPALIGLRFAQGLGAAAGIVIARAAVRDLFSGPEMAQFFSAMATVAGLAPIVAPAIGGQVLHWTAWPGIFVVLAGFGVVLLVATMVGLGETLPAHRRRPARPGGAARAYAGLIADRAFLAYCLSAGFVTGAMFAYIAGSPFVLQNLYGVSPQQYSAVFGANALGIVLVAQLNRVLLRRFAPRRLLSVGLGLSAAGGLAVAGVAVFDLGLWFLLPSLFVVVASVGMVTPNCTALAMADHAEQAGTASALLGLIQFVIGGAAAPLVGLGGDDSAVGMGVVVAALAVLGAASSALAAPAREPARVG